MTTRYPLLAYICRVTQMTVWVLIYNGFLIVIALNNMLSPLLGNDHFLKSCPVLYSSFFNYNNNYLTGDDNTTHTFNIVFSRVIYIKERQDREGR